MHNPEYKLYHYWRSSTSWRVRWALEIKKLPYTPIHVHLLNGEVESPEHLKRNPAGTVPVLETSEGHLLTESLAIIQYLEELYPQPSLLPGTALDHARIWALAEVVNSGTHPIQNLPVLEKISADPIEQKKWAQFWIRSGLELYEKLSAPRAGNYSYGNELTIADLCLIPQCYNATRYEVDFRDLPTISRVNNSCLPLETLQKAHPASPP
jgi:maleylacetoacetate isomerase